MYRIVAKGPQTGSQGSVSPCTTPLIDPRVAKHGGTRTNPKHTYELHTHNRRQCLRRPR
jgi:hypothetical protein